VNNPMFNKELSGTEFAADIQSDLCVISSRIWQQLWQQTRVDQ